MYVVINVNCKNKKLKGNTCVNAKII